MVNSEQGFRMAATWTDFVFSDGQININRAINNLFIKKNIKRDCYVYLNGSHFLCMTDCVEERRRRRKFDRWMHSVSVCFFNFNIAEACEPYFNQWPRKMTNDFSCFLAIESERWHGYQWGLWPHNDILAGTKSQDKNKGWGEKRGLEWKMTQFLAL